MKKNGTLAKKLSRVVSEQVCVPAARSCNLACVYCHSPATGKAVSRAAAARLARSSGAWAVSLEGGGEPAAHPEELFGLIKFLRGKGVRDFMLSTNAVAFSDVKLAARAVRELDSFTVNLPACGPKEYKTITRSDKFPLVVKALENLKALGAEGRVKLFHVVLEPNYRRLPRFADWVIREHPGVAFVNFTFVKALGRAARAPGLVPAYSDAERYIKAALRKLKAAGIKAVIQNFPLCRLKGCEGFSFELQRWARGDKPIEQGIQAPLDLPLCRKCLLKPACPGARPDYVKIHGFRELRPSRLNPLLIRLERF